MAGRTHYTPSLLLGLLTELPEDAALTVAIRGPEWRGWTRQTQLLADLYDAIGRLTQAAGRWRRKPPKFQPYPRPKRRRRATTIADIKRRLLPRELKSDSPGG